MKKILTLLVCMTLFVGVQAQVIGIFIDGTPTDVSGTIVDLAGGEEIHEDFDIVNESGSAYILRVTRAKIQTVSGSTDYLCWGKDAASGICYPASTVGPNDPWTTPDAYTWNPLDTGLLSVYHQANGYVGVAMYRYYIIDDMGTQLDSVDVRFTSTVGIEDPKEVTFSAYPNPASNIFNIEMSDNADGDIYQLNIHNIMGQIVMHGLLTDGKNTVNVSTLKNGVYFYSILKNNKALETKKVVIRK